jgi:hypothetical protein
MRWLLVALMLLLVSPAYAQTGSNQTQAQLNTLVGTTGCSQPTCLFPDNTTGLITPFDLRQVFLDTVATLFTSFRVAYSGAVPTLSSCGVNPSIDSNATTASGTVTPGSTATTCTIAFNYTFGYNHCRVIAHTATTNLIFSYTATRILLTPSLSNLGGNTFEYECDGF